MREIYAKALLLLLLTTKTTTRVPLFDVVDAKKATQSATMMM